MWWWLVGWSEWSVVLFCIQFLEVFSSIFYIHRNGDGRDSPFWQNNHYISIVCEAIDERWEVGISDLNTVELRPHSTTRKLELFDYVRNFFETVDIIVLCPKNSIKLQCVWKAGISWRAWKYRCVSAITRNVVFSNSRTSSASMISANCFSFASIVPTFGTSW